MPRLFVAVDMGLSTIEVLSQLPLPRQTGVRPTAPAQRHLTLHFLGEKNLAQVATALETVVIPAFELTVAGVGKFSSADGGAILWAGVQASAELLSLHVAVAAALAGTGFRPEARRYSPHLTLARCKPCVPASVVNDLLTRAAEFSRPPETITEFHLYSSTLGSAAPEYHCERSYPLMARRVNLEGLTGNEKGSE